MLSAVLGLKAWRVHDQSATVMITFTQRSDFAGNVPWISFISIFCGIPIPLFLLLLYSATHHRNCHNATNVPHIDKTVQKQRINCAPSLPNWKCVLLQSGGKSAEAHRRRGVHRCHRRRRRSVCWRGQLWAVTPRDLLGFLRSRSAGPPERSTSFHNTSLLKQWRNLHDKYGFEVGFCISLFSFWGAHLLIVSYYSCALFICAWISDECTISPAFFPTLMAYKHIKLQYTDFLKGNI